MPESVDSLPKSLRVYATTLDTRSYDNPVASGKVWKNLVLYGKPSPCGIQVAAPDFHFAQTPTFLAPDVGLGLGDNSLAGPQSHQLGVDGDGSYTVALVFQPTGPPPVLDAVSVFQIFANGGAGNNGFALTMRTPNRAPGPKQPSQQQQQRGREGFFAATPMVSADFFLQVGTSSAVQSSAPVSLDPSHRYLIVASRDRGSMSASLVDLDDRQRGYTKTPLVGPAPVPSNTPRVSLANVDMAINGSNNWGANVIAIGVYAEALGDGALNDLYRHYTAALREHDPVHIEAKAQIEAARVATACPYDDPTCAQCGGVKEWSAASASIVTAGGASCLAAIDRFCAANPKHARCSCWDSTSPEYGRSCAAYRAVFSGKAYDVTGCPVPDANPHEKPPQPQTVDSLVTSILSPHNVDAVTKLIGAVRGADRQTAHNVHANGNANAKKNNDQPAAHKRGKNGKHGMNQKCGGRKDDDGCSSSSSSDDDDEDGHHAAKKKTSPGFWAWMFGYGTGHADRKPVRAHTSHRRGGESD